MQEQTGAFLAVRVAAAWPPVPVRHRQQLRPACLLFTTNTWWSAHCVAILDASLPTWSRGSTPHKTTAIIGQESCNIHWQKFCSFHFRRLLRVAKIKGVITIIHLTVSIHVYRCLYIQIFRLLFFSKYKTHRGAMCRCLLLQ